MSTFDEQAFSERVAAMFDDQIIAMLSINAPQYNSEAIQIARAEADRRGIVGDVQTVAFDVFLNSVGFAGRLILLEEQLMYLSTGIKAASAGRGLVGAIAGEAHEAERKVAASRLDFSALDNEGSWIYFLDQIAECRMESKILSGAELQFVINEESGSTLNGVVNCGALSKTEAQELADQILAARDRFAAAGTSK